MGCNCTQTDGFAKAMQNARATEIKTGTPQAVFVLKESKTAYYGALNSVKKRTDICCYYLTSGEEIEMKEKTEPSEKVTKLKGNESESKKD